MAGADCKSTAQMLADAPCQAQHWARQGEPAMHAWWSLAVAQNLQSEEAPATCPPSHAVPAQEHPRHPTIYLIFMLVLNFSNILISQPFSSYQLVLSIQCHHCATSSLLYCTQTLESRARRTNKSSLVERWRADCRAQDAWCVERKGIAGTRECGVADARTTSLTRHLWMSPAKPSDRPIPSADGASSWTTLAHTSQ